MDIQNELNKCIRVSNSTNVAKLGSAIYAYYKATPNINYIELKAIGAGAVNQAIKGAIISGKHFANIGKKVYILPSFFESEVSGIRLKLEIHDI